MVLKGYFRKQYCEDADFTCHWYEKCHYDINTPAAIVEGIFIYVPGNPFGKFNIVERDDREN